MLPNPLRLTDAELDAVMRAARPLDVRVRDAFLQSVADALKGCGEIGSGSVHRAARELQRRFLTDPPQVPRNQSRWSSRRRNGVRAAVDG